MSDETNEVPEAPATWENEVVGKAKEALGHVLHKPDLVEEGEDQDAIAHDVRDEYQREREQ